MWERIRTPLPARLESVRPSRRLGSVRRLCIICAGRKCASKRVHAACIGVRINIRARLRLRACTCVCLIRWKDGRYDTPHLPFFLGLCFNLPKQPVDVMTFRKGEDK